VLLWWISIDKKSNFRIASGKLNSYSPALYCCTPIYTKFRELYFISLSLRELIIII